MQRLSYEELTANFIALSVKRKLEAARRTYKASIFNQVVEFFLTGLSERCNLPYKDAVDTKSNLSSDIFREIVIMLNIDYSFYVTKEHFIDEKLLKNRNYIAHGQYLTMTITDYILLHREIISLMEIFRNQIINSAITNAYRRQPRVERLP
jgi:hypothetical protein